MNRPKTLRSSGRPDGGASSPWMITFTDLLTLLLVFFVLQFSMASFEKVDLRAKLQVESDAKAPRRAVASAAQARNSRLTAVLENQLGSSPIQSAVKGEIKFEGGISVESRKQVSVIALGSENFSSGSRELSPRAAAAVAAISQAIAGSLVHVRVEGHTDDLLINTVQFPSNWELSTARAITVAQELIKNGFPASRISAIGYADARPLADNSNEEGRAKNRRVEILIEQIAD